MVLNTYNPIPQEAEERGLQIPVKPGLHSNQSVMTSNKKKKEGKANLWGLMEAAMQGAACPESCI